MPVPPPLDSASVGATVHFLDNKFYPNERKADKSSAQSIEWLEPAQSGQALAFDDVQADDVWGYFASFVLATAGSPDEIVAAWTRGTEELFAQMPDLRREEQKHKWDVKTRALNAALGARLTLPMLSAPHTLPPPSGPTGPTDADVDAATLQFEELVGKIRRAGNKASRFLKRMDQRGLIRADVKARFEEAIAPDDLEIDSTLSPLDAANKLVRDVQRFFAAVHPALEAFPSKVDSRARVEAQNLVDEMIEIYES